MADVCLEFEELLVNIKVNFINKKNEISEKLWYAANAAYTKLTKYYTKISSRNFAIATVLDPRCKLDVYDTTDDPVALKSSAKVNIELAFEEYKLKFPQNTENIVQATVTERLKKKPKRYAHEDQTSVHDELVIYLDENRAFSETDPLQYWKANQARFPILARMARDYLGLQPTSKDVEGNFSKGRRTIPYYRRSQNASTIRTQMLVNSGYNLGTFNK